MAVYSVTFHLEPGCVNGRSYEQRHTELQEAIFDGTTRFWDQADSFYVIETRRPIDEIAKQCKRAIEPTTDLVMVREMSGMPTRISGNNLDPDIFQLMPYVKCR